jgi:hypothetical protein
MWLRRFLQQFTEYSKSSEFLHGLFIELSGIAVEVILLSILVPIAVHLYNRRRSRSVRFQVSFYLSQVLHKIAGVFLAMAGLEDYLRDVLPILVDEQARNPHLEIYSHAVYGNLENKIFVLRQVLGEESFREGLAKRSSADFSGYCETLDQCVVEIDRLAAILVPLRETWEKLFSVRMLIYPLRDRLCEAERALADRPADLRGLAWEVSSMAPELVSILEALFAHEKRNIDSVMRPWVWMSKVGFYVRLIRNGIARKRAGRGSRQDFE